MNIEKIRDALEAAANITELNPNNYGSDDVWDLIQQVREVLPLVDEALAELDKAKPGKALTDDMIETVSAVWATRTGKDRVARADFEAGMKEALHGGLLSPAPVDIERIMEAFDLSGGDFLSAEIDGGATPTRRNLFLRRLTTLFNTLKRS